MLPIERLAEIDRELDAFEKSDEVLGAVFARAREVSPSGLGAVDAALEALGDGMSLAEAFIAGSAPTEPQILADGGTHPDTRAPEGGTARPASWDERAPVRDDVPDDASGLVELSDEMIRGEALPPVLSLPPETEVPETRERLAVTSDAPSELAIEDGTDVRDANSLELALAEHVEQDLPEPATRSGAIGIETTREDRLPVKDADEGALAHLFDDAPSPTHSAPPSGGLADLFDDALMDERPEAEPAAHESLSDLLSPELRAELRGDDEPEDSTSLFTAAEMHAVRDSFPPPRPKKSALDAELEAALSVPLAETVEPSGMPTSGEFELMIDEDVLVLDDGDGDGLPAGALDTPPPPRPPNSGTMPPPVPGSIAPPSGSQPPPGQKGFFSRILNRK